MKNIKILSVLVILLTALNSCCGNKNKQQEEASSTDTTAIPIWVGYYYGELPCASCPAIRTSITLNEDGTFEKTTEYINQKDGFYITKGQIKWSDDKTKITLDEESYLVGQDNLTMLDASGNTIAGKDAESYILWKSNLAEEPEVDMGIVQQYKGDNGKEYQITFNTSGDKPTALVEEISGSLKKTLIQTESWAKGAIYSSGDITLEAKNIDAILTIGNKKIVLKEDK